MAATAARFYDLRAGDFSARFLNYGARWVSMWTLDRQGRKSDVLLGFDSAAEYQNDGAAFGAIVGRFANRIAHGRFSLGGRQYQLEKNLGAHHLHGGHVGFGNCFWEADQSGPESVEFRLESSAGAGGYPGNVSVRAHYRLEASGLLRLQLDAISDEPTILNLTNHAYFNLGSGKTVLDHLLWIHADRWLEIDKEGIPTGALRPTAGSGLDLSQHRKLADVMKKSPVAEHGGLDHCFELLPAEPSFTAGSTDLASLNLGNAPVTRPVASLREPLSGRRLVVETSEPGMQVYSGNGLEGTVGRNGRIYQKYAGICLECQNFPDAINQPHFPSCLVGPGRPYRQTTLFRFGLMEE